MLNFAARVQRKAYKMYLIIRYVNRKYVFIMNTKTIVKLAMAATLAVLALASCKKDRHRNNPDGPEVPQEQVTEGLSVKATFYGDYYEKGFMDYILLFQLGEIGEDGYFKKNGVELSLDVLTATGGPTLFPAGIYEITNDKYNSAGIIPSIENKDDEGNISYGDTYLYTQQDADNYWLEPLESARLEVAVEGAQYTIKVQISVGGEEYKYLYKGPLSIEDKSESEGPSEEGPEGDYDFKADDIHAFNLGHEWSTDTDDWMIYLVNDKDEDEWIAIEIVSASGSNPEAFPEGTFSVPADFYNDKYEIVAGIMCPLYQYEESYYGTYYVFGGEIWYSASSGNVKITKSGDNYTVALSFLDEEYDNAQVTSTFTGKVDVDVSEYYDGALTATRIRKTVPAFKKSVVKRADKKRQTKAASKIACRLS